MNPTIRIKGFIEYMVDKKRTRLTGWGNYPECVSSVVRPEKLPLQLTDECSIISRGLGRSYGDAALNAGGEVLLTERLNHCIAFDAENGIVRAESGVTLADLLAIFVPRGWFLPVTPGTQFATLGGCVAADVHGKNHHAVGSFCQHVAEITLQLADGSVTTCSATKDADLFWATAGGMGLTGLIIEVALKLIPVKSAYMEVTHQKAAHLQELLSLCEQSIHAPYSVAWIDCLAKGKHFGRGIVMNGKHSEEMGLEIPPRKALSIPCHFPSWVMNRFSIKVFNQIYYHTQKRKREPFIIDYERFFYPLDAVHHWNRCYGKKGFVQYQCVIPSRSAHEGIEEILKRLTESQRGSFLAVLKRFGEGSPGHLSFPMEGYTLALDIPIKDPQLFVMLNELDEQVLHYGGRVYLAKDACLQPDHFRKMYPRFADWWAIKKQVDPEQRFSSSLSQRLQMEQI